MRLLLDTHIVLWAVSDLKRLRPHGRALVEDRNNQVFFSAVCVWEVAIKFALRRPDFQIPPASLVEYALQSEFIELPVTSRAAAGVADLPHHHRDPFDRLLIAQAIDADARLLTADATLGLYGSNVLALV
jgi:PIN domain nuclease of toxin-antitoxin system